jgi:RNA polymerase sigma-70 factor, ECF subfamily
VPWLRPRSNSPDADDAEQSAAAPVSVCGSEEAALAAAALVQPEAFTFLYDRYVARIYAYCYVRLGHREAAEDATSDVFLQALRDLGSFRGGLFAAWLFRIAQHTVIDHHRRARYRMTTPLDDAADIDSGEELVEARIVAAGELETLRAAISRLPADQRAVLELQLADLTPQEIAATLGRSLNAIRHLRMRAFRQLRPLLRADNPRAA